MKKAVALAITTPDLSDSLAVDGKELKEALSMVEAFTIAPVGHPDHADTLAFAEESRALTKGQWVEYEAQRTSVTGPLNAVLKTVNGWFKPVQSTLKAMEQAWSKKIVDVALAAREEQQRLIVEARAEDAPEILRDTLVAASESVIATMEVRLRDRWVFEVVDPAQVPREYLCPDEKKIGAVVGAMGEKASIPGVRVWNSPIVSGPSR